MDIEFWRGVQNKGLPLAKLVPFQKPCFEVTNQIDHKRQNTPFRNRETPEFSSASPKVTTSLVGLKRPSSLFVYIIQIINFKTLNKLHNNNFLLLY